jgi:molybdopterin molybdotransferase
MRIPTGGMLPAGRRGRHGGAHPDVSHAVAIERTATRMQHVMRRGEDAKKGTRLFARGHRIRPADVGALSGIGLARVWVVRRPRVAVIATGDEIVPPDVTPRAGQVRNVNQYALRALISAAGSIPVDFGVLPDREDVIRAAMRKALRTADAVLVSGGSPVGTKTSRPPSSPPCRRPASSCTVFASPGPTSSRGPPGNPIACPGIRPRPRSFTSSRSRCRLLGGEPAARRSPRARSVAAIARASPRSRSRLLSASRSQPPRTAAARHRVAGGSGDIVGLSAPPIAVRIAAEDAELPVGRPASCRPDHLTRRDGSLAISTIDFTVRLDYQRPGCSSWPHAGPRSPEPVYRQLLAPPS